jgi:very-short-patch-repair endonuclease
VEAERLVDLVIDQARREPQKSVGVITFSERQMVTVQADIDARKRNDSSLEALLREAGSDAFFVKNLENVQGDERDIILFSVGYGPDSEGKMTMNFGPLNRQGGERRLNVAVTRAREVVKILASFRPEDIDLGRTKAKGVHLLREYLTFAEHGPVTLSMDTESSAPHFESLFEQAVADSLRAAGLEVEARVGVGQQRIDLGIQSQSQHRYVFGIECDGTAYRHARTARDRDRLRDQVLTSLGWSVQHIWSTDWIKDPTRDVHRMMAEVEARAVRDGRDPSAAVAAQTLVDGDSIDTELPEGRDIANTESDDPPNASFAISTPSQWVPIGTPYRRTQLPSRRYVTCFARTGL